MGLDDVLSDLEEIGYTARPVVVPACAVNAPHRRDRVWILGHAAGTLSLADAIGRDGWANDEGQGPAERNRAGRCGEDAAHANRESEPAFAVDDHPRQRQLGARDAADTDSSGSGELHTEHEAEQRMGINPHGISAGLVQPGGRIDGTSNETDTSEVLRTLRGADAEEAVWRALRGLRAIHAPGVLRQDVLQRQPCQACAIEDVWQEQVFQEVPWDILRCVWGWDSFADSSHRQRSLEQLAREHSDLVYFLSHFTPPPGTCCWSSGRWESGVLAVPRVVATEKDRVNKLKALGNSIVPQVAYQILMAMVGE
jgi:site-specific DNA-cytosine methylase